MSIKSDICKSHEQRIIQKVHTRFARRYDIESLPFSEEELRTLVERSREFHRAYGSEAKRARKIKFKNHLARDYGNRLVDDVWLLLEKINNEIGFEEK